MNSYKYSISFNTEHSLCKFYHELPWRKNIFASFILPSTYHLFWLGDFCLSNSLTSCLFHNPAHCCCAVRSAPAFCLLRYGGFLEDIGAVVEVNPDDQYQFLSVYTRHNAPLRSRDYHVTFPRVFPTGLWGVRYSLFIIYS